jgi:hypothetical protein
MCFLNWYSGKDKPLGESFGRKAENFSKVGSLEKLLT